ncbi:MAG: AMP-binding protein, partial [Flavobacteriaceae bacterium]
MKIVDIINLCKEKGVRFFLKDGRLGIKDKNTLNLSPNFLQLIKDNKKDIIDFLENELNDIKSNFALSEEQIIPQSRPNRIPLSFAQEGLWFLDKLVGSSNYHIPIVLKLKGNVDIVSLDSSLRNILISHEVLRTVILEESGVGYQHVLEVDDFVISRHDGIKKDVLSNYITDLVEVSFDLSSDYMLRADLVSISDNEHVLVCVMHHIASDGWSIPLFFQEFSTHYTRLSQGFSSEAVTNPIQYADYSIWQRGYLKDAVLEKKLAYWKNSLEGTGALTLPTDYIRPPVQSFKGSSYDFILEQEVASSLQELTSSTGSSLFITVLGIFNVFLSRYSGQQDICIGTPVANRGQQEVESLIGFFVNTLALRNELDYQESFIDFISRVKDKTLEAYDHQDVPFEKVVNSLSLDRDSSRTPLFQVMLSLQNNQGISGSIELGGLELAGQSFEYGVSKYDLTLNVSEGEGLISLSFEYCTDLFLKSTIKQMAGHLVHLTKEIVNAPNKVIGSYQMLTSTERLELLEEFNAPEVNYPKDVTVLDLFKSQVASNPENIALVYEDHSLSYGDLDHRSSVLAKELIDKGVKKGDLVAICMDRSMEMIVGILSILKSGGAYVPIDPSYPKDRISYILEDTSTSILITNSSTIESLDLKDSLEVLTIDLMDLSVGLENYNVLELKGEDLAYVIYTSGSTGFPKGVMIEHNSLYETLEEEYSILEIKGDIRTCLLTNFVFDVSVLEINLALCYGGTIVIPNQDSLLDKKKILNLFDSQKVNILQGTPSFLDGVLYSDKEQLSWVEQICVGGDSLTSTTFSRLKKMFPNASINNHYGPTEITIDALVHRNIKELTRNIVGKPISNKSVYILDAGLNLLPVGVVGEICVSGIGLSRGYLNNEELTKEKFVSHPFK